MKRKNLLTSALVGACLLFSASAMAGCSFLPSTSSSPEAVQQTEIEKIYAQYVTYTETIGGQPLSYEAWLASIRGEDGEDGKSAYQIWLENGYSGTQSDFLSWLKGEKGDKGEQGLQGVQGEEGVGIVKVELTANGNLIFYFTDGTTQIILMPDFSDNTETPDEPEDCVHTFGDWMEYHEPNTDDRGYFRVCAECGATEWREDDCVNHTWTVVTTDPTCYAKGYDTKTCTDCGRSERDNYTAKSEHDWATDYTYDATYHWYACTVCSETQEKFAHTIGDDGDCAVCGCPTVSTVGVIYDVSGDGTYAEVIGYEGTETIVRIADTYNGLPVTKIYDNAFYDNRNIQSVIIPDSITTIGKSAFAYCDNLTNVVIPDSVTTIGGSAFSDCDSFTSVVIPDSVTSLGHAVFFACDNLTHVVIGNGVTSISNQIVDYCPQLVFNTYGNCKYLGNPDNPYVALIEVTATNLSGYAIHGDTKVIADSAFSGCSRLSNIYITDVGAWCGISNLYELLGCNSLEKRLYLNGELVTDLVIPEGVTEIKGYAFYRFSFTSVVIPDSVTSIAYGAFEYCDDLTCVYYQGTADEWNAISIDSCNWSLTGATRYYYSETEASGRWRYVDGVPTLW